MRVIVDWLWVIALLAFGVEDYAQTRGCEDIVRSYEEM
jgi:hypothetical protein